MATVRQARDDLARRGIAPDGLALSEAAAFVGLSVNTFLREVKAGTLPPPLPLQSRRRIWSRAALARLTAQGDTLPEPDFTDEIDKAIDEYAA